ncbi:histidinol dehydrogenase [Reichenbachiella agariperforans]|uniref:Histidinol dehydrogenase n=1 Tax=Reichenbachiella agariperforans TaxID=156994 RepID=A0A1M6NKU0_REIAG|nr:histidinol dehydrogenase [Reichenbachiella agariperforans]SHJ96142.1 histidinol dehydrogenase [Reichenbachiella agariperforans]
MIVSLYPKKSEWAALTQRPVLEQQNLQSTVDGVFDAIKTNGDQAVLSFTERFDKAQLSSSVVSDQEIKAAQQRISDELKAAIQLAAQNIETFHAAQKPGRVEVETAPGVVCWQEAKGIQKVGIYIPGGTAPLFSTVLMLAIPATIAGCDEIVLCTPPGSDGSVNPAILFAAQYAGVKQVYKVGGIQAIGAMTFGTESIPKVDKIFGPGNQYVTAAKQRAAQLGVAIDMPAGPSELLVMADETAVPAFVVSDLLSQAEHGIDSQVICVIKSESQVRAIQSELEAQLAVLPRKEIAQKAIANSKIICIAEDQDCVDFINEYAPEHYILCVQNEDFYLDQVRNAGSVFIGNYTPESAGDYASGTNHTLPTNGYAKSYSGVNLDSFMKKITFQRITATGIQNIGPAIEHMAAAELLDAHKNAVTVRLDYLKTRGE